MSTEGKMNKITTAALKEMKKKGEKISMLTAYDFPTAAIMDNAGIDMILIGDSVGMVVLGYDSTLPVTMDDMIHHTKMVSRAVKRAMVVGDMPFMSYQASIEEGRAQCRAVHERGRRTRGEARRRQGSCRTDEKTGSCGNSRHGPYRSDTAIRPPARGL